MRSKSSLPIVNFKTKFLIDELSSDGKRLSDEMSESLLPYKFSALIEI